MNENIRFIDGGISSDERGRIAHVNELDMTEIRRFYVIRNKDTATVRAWHGHQHERKWFYAVKGSFRIALVRIDNWESPSETLVPEIYTLSEQSSRVLQVPAGYANGVQALEEDSVLLVYSDKILSEAVNDSWRYDKNLWVDWNAPGNNNHTNTNRL